MCTPEIYWCELHLEAEMVAQNKSENNGGRQRVYTFVDFWNFELSLQNEFGRFRADFQQVPQVITKAASELVDPTSRPEYAGMSVYMSSDTSNQKEMGLRKWATNFLDKMPGVNVSMLDRVRKVAGPKCPVCHDTVHKCPACNADMRGTQEKGVDVKIATEMIMLAWAESYDIAVLVSSDSDFVPVADFLQTKGVKVIHGSFPPKGAELSQKCWGSIDMTELASNFKLPERK